MVNMSIVSLIKQLNSLFVFIFSLGYIQAVELSKQQLEELRSAHEGYESLAAELDILRTEKNEIVNRKESEIEELKAQLDGIQSEEQTTAGNKQYLP